MEKNKKFNSYNQIIKEFEVYIVKSTNNKYKIELVRKPDGPTPPKPLRDSKPPKWFKEFVDNQFLPLINKIDNLENLVITQFKTHGWIK